MSYYNWIPEAVYATTSATSKRAKNFSTPLGDFRYYCVPSKHLLMNVGRVDENTSVYLLADPWKALAHYIYVHKKNWESINDVEEDMRIERETMLNSNLSSLNLIKANYPNEKVKEVLILISRDLRNEKTLKRKRN